MATAVLADPGVQGGKNESWQRYAGSYETDALLAEPAIRASLEVLLGEELAHFLNNLDVRGSIDLVAGSLSVSGNAPHAGGSEEAVLCVSTYNHAVSVAMLSQGDITIYSPVADYASQSLCIKDWITQANSGHSDRFVAPENVTLVTTDTK